LPAAWRGARRARVPFVLWSALWAQLSTPAHLVARPLMAWIYRDADAVVAYGPHVADFARAHGATNVHVAPQAVDNAFWSEPPSGAVAADATAMPFTCAFAGRAVAEKGLDVLLGAWERCGLRTEEAVLLLAGPGLEPATAQRDGVVALGALPPIELRNFYARADVLVIPSIATRSFREPWGLVANEAMNQLTAIIASDAVGAAAGGLVRHERNGLIVAAGDETPLAAAIRRLHDESELRRRMTVTGAADVGAYTYEAWAEGFAGALSTADDGRNPC
jgi:glycosyltransferase involved in cell wall biosynthesis